MFLGRTDELKYLNNYYDREGSQIVVVYGSKNIGKKALINKFLEGKPSYFYSSRSCSERQQLYQWGMELAKEEVCVLKYPSFQEIFKAILENQSSKMVLVINEFHHLIKTCPHFMSDLISFIHSEWNKNKIMVILCSSHVGWVENSMIKKIGAAAYELSGLLKVKELKFYDLIQFFPGFSQKQCIEVFSILGGYPGLWCYFNDKLSVKENIIQTIIHPLGPLHNMALSYVEEELRETSVYNTILSSLAEGKYKLNDLYHHTYFSRAKISVYLKNLMELEIIEKVFSVDTDGYENTKKGLYRISNPFVNFYYNFLYSNQSKLYSVSPKEFYNTYISPVLRFYVSYYFNIVCSQYLDEKNNRNKLPFVYNRCGEWVGKSGTIDIIAKNEDNLTLVSFCNYEKPMMTYEDYENYLLITKKAKIELDYIYLFSIDRFDEKLELEAKIKKNMFLISFKE